MTQTPGTSSLQGKHLFQYFQEIQKYEPLSSSEERELSARIGQGDTEARDALVRANLRFVVSIARKNEGRGMCLLDLICEGNVGLLRAAEKFDGEKGFRFISYAVWWIRQAIREALSQHTRTVRLPMNRVAALRQIGKVSRELEQGYGRSVTVEEITDEIGMGEAQIRAMLAMSRNSVSLDASREEEDEICLLDMVEDRHPSPEEDAVDRVLEEDLGTVITSLDKREGEVLRMYFGLGGRERMTLGEIGVVYGLTRERIRQIKKRALAKLRRRAHKRHLESYLEG